MADVEEPQYEEEVAEEVVDAEEEAEEEDEYAYADEGTEVKLFGKWSFDDVEVRDISLVVSIDVPPESYASVAAVRVASCEWLTKLSAQSRPSDYTF